MKTLTITSLEEGQRFDKYLQKYLRNASKGFIYKMLRKKNITLNGRKADGSEKLADGDTIALFFKDETLEILMEYASRSDFKMRILDYPPTGSAKANFISMLNYVDEPYVMFCDHDDVWLDDKIERSLKTPVLAYHLFQLGK